MHLVLTLEAQIWVYSAIRAAIKSEEFQTDPENLTVKSTLYTLSPYPRGPHILVQKCTELTFNDLEHLKVKSTLYLLYTCPRDLNSGPFYSMTSRFEDTRQSQI